MSRLPNRHDPELTALLSALVAIPGVSGEERPVQEHILAWLADQGIAARIEPADGGLVNLVAELRGAAAPDGPTLWIGGHADTVSAGADWTRDPHLPGIEDGRLYGLGAMDMKGGMAAALLAVRDLARQPQAWCGRIVLAALADEEAYSRGANAHVRGLGGIDAAIMCEPHFHDVVVGAMGKANLQVEVTGRSAHASYPEQGVNAVTEAARLIAAIGALPRHPHPVHGSASHCVLNVSSGDGRYEIRVPDKARFTVNWHFMPGETIADGVATLQALADGLGSGARFDITVGTPLYESFELSRSGAPGRFLDLFAESYRATLGAEPDFRFGRGVSDANIMAGRAGIPCLLFGPSGANMHAGDEWVDLDQLNLARTLYRDFALRFLAPTVPERPRA